MVFTVRFSRQIFPIVIVAGGLQASGAFAGCADVALVLAIDSSGSIDTQDFAVQQQGYAAAFRDPRVQHAMAAAGVVDVAVIMWGDTEMAPQVIPWQRIASARDADAMARHIAGVPRKVSGDTGIGRGLWLALDLLDAAEGCAQRRIVNVSGDGPELISSRARNHVPLRHARDRAAAMGVTVNGLAITHEVADLDLWYQERVIVGPGSFVMAVADFDSFAEAIARKLDREIGPPDLAALAAPAQVTP